MSILSEPKASATVRQESINWLPQLSLSSPIDTISSSTWTTTDGLVSATPTKTNSVATCKVSGGRVGAYCNLKNTIVTAAGYTYTETIIIEITPT